MTKPIDTRIPAHPGDVPKSPIIWPADRQKSNQIEQTKVTARPQATFALPTTQPATSVVPPRTTPAHVANVRVVTRAAVNGQKTVVVQFSHPSNDPHFQGASVYLKKAGGEPTQVASGNKSPLSFTVPVSTAPHALHVVSFGPAGENNVLTSPAHHVRLV